MADHFECEVLIKDWIKRFPLYFCLELFLLVRKQKELDIWVGSTSQVHCWKFLSLDNHNSQLKNLLFDLYSNLGALHPVGCSSSRIGEQAWLILLFFFLDYKQEGERLNLQHSFQNRNPVCTAVDRGTFSPFHPLFSLLMTSECLNWVNIRVGSINRRCLSTEMRD